MHLVQIVVFITSPRTAQLRPAMTLVWCRLSAGESRAESRTSLED